MLAALKSWLRATPQGCGVGLDAPQEEVEVRAHWADRETEVTGDAAVAALGPFTLRVGLPPGTDGATLARLSLVERDSRRPIGTLGLRHVRDWDSNGARMGLYEVRAGHHECTSIVRRTWDRFLYRRAARGRPQGMMTAEGVAWCAVFYSCPRPVYFVSVDDGHNSNLFPMDLVGALSPNYFTLALRNTSPSVETIRTTRRVALGDVPATAAALAYQLGKHHKMKAFDWSALPGQVLRTPGLGLQLPEISLMWHELAILDYLVVGSHTLFLARVTAERRLAAAPQLFHVSGAYQAFRARQGRGFSGAAAGPSVS